MYCSVRTRDGKTAGHFIYLERKRDIVGKGSGKGARHIYHYH